MTRWYSFRSTLLNQIVSKKHLELQDKWLKNGERALSSQFYSNKGDIQKLCKVPGGQTYELCYVSMGERVEANNITRIKCFKEPIWYARKTYYGSHFLIRATNIKV